MEKPYHGAGILIWSIDKDNNILVLLGNRSINPAKGKWSIPGGQWDIKKDLYDECGKPKYLKTAIRETKEELFLKIDNTRDVNALWKIDVPYFHFKVYSHQLPTQRKFNHNFEFNELKWFNISDLPINSMFFIKSQVSKLKHQIS